MLQGTVEGPPGAPTRALEPRLILDWMQARLGVDPEAGTIIWLDPPSNHPRLRGLLAGSPRKTRHGKVYWHIKYNRFAIKRSWLIFLWAHGRWPTDCLDHADGNSGNDAIGNLREATVLQNAWNHKKRARPSTSNLPMGIRLSHGRFQARIGYRKTQIPLGSFATVEEALAIYAAKRRELYNDFA
jgi:hypothetical protein